MIREFAHYSNEHTSYAPKTIEQHTKWQIHFAHWMMIHDPDNACWSGIQWHHLEEWQHELERHEGRNAANMALTSIGLLYRYMEMVLHLQFTSPFAV